MVSWYFLFLFFLLMFRHLLPSAHVLQYALVYKDWSSHPEEMLFWQLPKNLHGNKVTSPDPGIHLSCLPACFTGLFICTQVLVEYLINNPTEKSCSSAHLHRNPLSQLRHRQPTSRDTNHSSDDVGAVITGLVLPGNSRYKH